MMDRIAPATPLWTVRDNLAFGLDTLISPTNDTSINAYWAKTDSPGRTGDDTSYRGRFDWNADKYGLSAEHLSVGTDFNPEVGFLRPQHRDLLIVDTTLDGLLDKMAAHVPTQPIVRMNTSDL